VVGTRQTTNLAVPNMGVKHLKTESPQAKPVAIVLIILVLKLPPMVAPVVVPAAAALALTLLVGPIRSETIAPFTSNSMMMAFATNTQMIKEPTELLLLKHVAFARALLVLLLPVEVALTLLVGPIRSETGAAGIGLVKLVALISQPMSELMERLLVKHVALARDSRLALLLPRMGVVCLALNVAQTLVVGPIRLETGVIGMHLKKLVARISQPMSGLVD